jgi:large subunit ribosomal protein L4
VHLLEAGQLNTYDVLVSDEVVFTETALAEFVAGPHGGGSGAGGGTTSLVKPDLTTPDIPGAIPSMQPAQGTTDLDLQAGADTATDSTEEKA